MAKRAVKNNGLSLIELMPVIVILALSTVGVGGIISTSSKVFMDVSARDELLSSVRFSVERLNREVRYALPNSVRVYNLLNGSPVEDLFQEGIVKCIEYIPTLGSTVYLDVPVIPEVADTLLTVIRFDESVFFDERFLQGEVHAVVNPLKAEQVYDTIADPITGITDSTSTRRYRLNLSGISKVGQIIDNLWTLNLVEKALFAENSPTKRLYLVNQPVAYCASANQLTRYTGYGFTGVPFNDNNDPLVAVNGEPLVDDNGEPLLNNDTELFLGTGVTMAEGIEISETFFTVQEASDINNTLIDITLKFSKNDETLTFFNQVQVLNVP